jgi:hypothetical protein
MDEIVNNFKCNQLLCTKCTQNSSVRFAAIKPWFDKQHEIDKQNTEIGDAYLGNIGKFGAVAYSVSIVIK